MTRNQWLKKVQSTFPRNVQNNLGNYDWRTLKWDGQHFKVKSKRTGLNTWGTPRPKHGLNLTYYSRWSPDYSLPLSAIDF